MSRAAIRNPSYAAGVAASIIAETVFIAMVMAVAWVRDRDPWMVTRVPASFLLGPEAVRPPGLVAEEVLLGLLMHLWLAVVVGLAYAALLPRLRLSPVAGGLVAAAVLYLLGFWALPQVFPERLAPFWLPPTGRLLQAAAHLVYGVVFGVAYGLVRDAQNALGPASGPG